MAADLLGTPIEATCARLGDFASDPEENPGRLNEFRIGDVHILVDFAHNLRCFEVFFEMSNALPAAAALGLHSMTHITAVGIPSSIIDW